MVPSLFAFFENLKYLEPCAKIMRSLLPTKHRRSISQAFSTSYYHPPEAKEEHSGGDIRIHDRSSASYDRNYAYQQLWLFALRNFSKMTESTPRKESKKPKPAISEPKPGIWKSFGNLAWNLGFHLEPAERYGAQEVEEQLTLQINTHLTLEDVDSEALQRIADTLRGLKKRRFAVVGPISTSDYPLATDRRCGRPFEDSHVADQQMLFLPQIYSCVPPSGLEVTTFYCTWDMFRSFMNIDLYNVTYARYSSLPNVVTTTETDLEATPPSNSSCAQCRIREADFELTKTRCTDLELQVASMANNVSRLQGDAGEARESARNAKKTALERERQLAASVEDLTAQLATLKYLEEQMKLSRGSEAMALHNLRGQLSSVTTERDLLRERLERLGSGQIGAESRLRDLVEVQRQFRQAEDDLLLAREHTAQNEQEQATLRAAVERAQATERELRQATASDIGRLRHVEQERDHRDEKAEPDALVLPFPPRSRHWI
ncbi:hypothetical protein LTR56_027198 [Elasticomyces elasticus]|nr:hypothetical protein LTR56_027198 [Elasticomyces elasticus]KAK3615861.1 hypothetical protein LTR22_027273 [Elasticomyces elasticus]KAK4899041.1 hypothetical protein LTR49_027711 [Elasticomyces elasticus]